jgi:hypothetical protein
MDKYKEFPEKFRTMKFDKTEKRTGLRVRNPNNISDTETSSESETEDEAPVVNRRSTRNKNKPNRYKP